MYIDIDVSTAFIIDVFVICVRIAVCVDVVVSVAVFGLVVVIDIVLFAVPTFSGISMLKVFLFVISASWPSINLQRWLC